MIVHLPVPFTGDPNEESNFAAIITQPERVHQFRSFFDSFWDNARASEIEDFISGLTEEELDTHTVILEHLGSGGSPLSSEDLLDALETVPNKRVERALQELESKFIIYRNRQGDICRTLLPHDILEEMRRASIRSSK